MTEAVRRIGTKRIALIGAAALIGVALLVTLLSGAGSSPASASSGVSDAQKAQAKPKPKTRPILAVSNNWDGTVDLVDPRTFKRLKRVNVVPDRAEREREIQLNPVDLIFFIAIRNQIGEGHDQLADDAFTSPDGRKLYVSRPSFADVVAIDIKSGAIVWRVEVDGQRSDHMAISKNGKRLLVSASTANVVHVIDTAAGKIIDAFESGDSPHESNFSADGKLIYHSSIGLVYTPTDMGQFDTSKGDRFFEIVDAKTYDIITRLDMGKVLDEAGYPDMSAAMRPMTLSPDERYLYFQVSFFHGFIEYDLKRKQVRRVVNLPISQEAQDIPKEDYLLDSAHHGIALSGDGKRLCVAGTMSDYAAIVNRKTGGSKVVQYPTGAKPYWSTESEDGRYCFVSISGADRVSVVSFRKRKEVASFPVGDHPQRMRTGKVRRTSLR